MSFVWSALPFIRGKYGVSTRFDRGVSIRHGVPRHNICWWLASQRAFRYSYSSWTAVADWVRPHCAALCRLALGGRSSVVIQNRRNSNTETLGSIPWRGAGSETVFSVPPSQLLCRVVCAWPPFVCTTRTQIGAHVKDPISICRKILGFTAGSMEPQKYCTQENKNTMDEPYRRLQSQGQGHVQNGLPLYQVSCLLLA